jgi:hypothetical protein
VFLQNQRKFPGFDGCLKTIDSSRTERRIRVRLGPDRGDPHQEGHEGPTKGPRGGHEGATTRGGRDENTPPCMFSACLTALSCSTKARNPTIYDNIAPPVNENLVFFYKFAIKHRVWRCLRRIGRSRDRPGILSAQAWAPKSQTALGIRRQGTAKRGQDSENTIWNRCGRGLTASAHPKPRVLSCFFEFPIAKASCF